MNEKKKYYYMGGSIIAVILVLLLSVMLLSSCSSKGNYKKIEKKLVEGAQKVINNGDLTVLEGNSAIVTSDQLVQAEYIKPLDKMKNDGCSGTVTIMNNGGSYIYLPYLTCNNYHTVTLKDQIVADSLTTEKDGLYSVDGEYVFKGSNPNNHVNFDGEDWLIVKIDGMGNLKLVKAVESSQVAYWDRKFNEQTDNVTGENEYETSTIAAFLQSMYDDYKSDYRKHLIPFDACVGKRTIENTAKSTSVDCAKKLSGQYIALISPSDYAQASYDKDCENVLSGSCINYNYLFNNLSETWTLSAIADNSYEVLLYIPGRFRRVQANEGHYYHAVVYISGNELYTDGDGSAKNPYVIK